MIRSVFTVAAEGIVVDERRNLLSVFNLIEDITPTVLPATLSKCTVVNVFERDPGDPDEIEVVFRVQLNGQELARAPNLVSFDGKSRFRFIIEVNGLSIAASGVLEMEFLLNGQVSGCCKILVRPPTDTVTVLKSTADRQSSAAKASKPIRKTKPSK